jgi:hypothetical protein
MIVAIAEPGWEEVALTALSWIERNVWLTATPVDLGVPVLTAKVRDEVPVLTG